MHLITTALLSLFMHAALAQTVSSFLPKTIDKKGRYLFYLHGGVVTVLGDNAINNGAPEWGPYEYSNILDSLRVRGFYVISERRLQGVEDSSYAAKICRQTDSLLKAGVPAQRIFVVSASAGWAVSYRVSHQLKNDSLHFVKIGGCRPDDYKEVENSELHGHFLSVIEKSDPRGPCDNLFGMQKHITSYKQVELNTGLNHGFFYKGRKEWIDPIVAWAGKNQ
jgi:hypothetical protein